MVRTKLRSGLGQLVAGKPPSGFARGAGKNRVRVLAARSGQVAIKFRKGSGQR